MTHTTTKTKQTKVKQQTQKSKKMEIDIELPKKLKTGSSGSIALNHKMSTKLGPEKLHSVGFDVEKNKLIVKGHSLICYVTPTATQVSFGGVGVVWRRIFLHPSLLFSRKLAYLGKMYAKYKFKKVQVEFQSMRPATATGSVHFAYSKDFSCSQPNPGISTVAWMSEMDGYKQCNVWESVKLPIASTEGDLPSYDMDRTQTDISTLYQNSVLICMSNPDNVTIGELYLHYEIEFDVMQAPPANFVDQNGYTAYGGNIIDGILKWRTTDAGQIGFWSSRSGIYYCQQVNTMTIFNDTAEFRNRNYAGMPFIMSVQGVQTSGWVGNYTAIEFEIYDSMASVLAKDHVETGATSTSNIIFEGTQLLSTSEPIVESVNPLQVINEDDSTSKSSNLCGISVGPGVLAGLPDVTPHLGMDHGRIHLGVQNPLSRRK